MPKVSVILTTYNGQRRGYLKYAIESVLHQTCRNYELIIVDDGSTDRTKALCSEYVNYRNVKYCYQENKGLGAARNLGMSKSIGSYICFLDDDDVWNPEKLRKQLDVFENSIDGTLGMLYTSLQLIDERGLPIGIQYHPAKGRIYERLFYENIVDAPSSVMIRRDVFDKVGVFKTELHGDEDYELWFRIAKLFSVFSIDEPLVQYRVHKEKMSANNEVTEMFQFVTLFYALADAPPMIRNRQDEFYCNLYKRFCLKHFYLGNFQQCKRYYRVARVYGPPGWGLRVKFMTCFVPSLFRCAKVIKKQYIGLTKILRNDR